MKKKKDRPLFFTLIRMAASVGLFFSLMKNLIELVKYEAAVAKRSLGYLILIAFMITTFFFTIWISCTCLFILGLLALQFSLAGALGIVLIINLLLLLICLLWMKKMKSQLLFPETYRFFCDLLDV